MADTSYSTFQHYGTNAERLAFTPDPPATRQPIYIWRETDTGDVYMYDTSWHLISRVPIISGANVFTDETQAAGAAFGDLATPGPSVTVTMTGTTAIVWFSAVTYRTGGSGNTSFLSVAVSGATTLAANDDNGTDSSSPGASFGMSPARVLYLTGLTPGSNTFTLKYRNDGGTTWHFRRRSIAVQAF